MRAFLATLVCVLLAAAPAQARKDAEKGVRVGPSRWTARAGTGVAADSNPGMAPVLDQIAMQPTAAPDVRVQLDAGVKGTGKVRHVAWLVDGQVRAAQYLGVTSLQPAGKDVAAWLQQGNRHRRLLDGKLHLQARWDITSRWKTTADLNARRTDTPDLTLPTTAAGMVGAGAGLAVEGTLKHGWQVALSWRPSVVMADPFGTTGVLPVMPKTGLFAPLATLGVLQSLHAGVTHTKGKTTWGLDATVRAAAYPLALAGFHLVMVPGVGVSWSRRSARLELKVRLGVDVPVTLDPTSLRPDSSASNELRAWSAAQLLFSMPVADASVGWQLSKRLHLEAGVRRSIQPVPDAAYASLGNAHLGIQWQWQDRVRVEGHTQVGALWTGAGTPWAPASARRFDVLALAGGSASISLWSWFVVGLNVDASMRAPAFQAQDTWFRAVSVAWMRWEY